MIVYRPYDDYDNGNPCVVALGNFDGVHIAHAKLLETAVHKARELSIQSAALIFEQHPENVLAGACVSPIITTNKEKAERIGELGIDNLIFINFSKEIATLSPYDFVKTILKEKLNANVCVCGFHYRFGSKAQAGADTLTSLCSDFGIETIVIEPVTQNDLIVSSTGIREFIRSGEIEKANEFLGRPFKVEYKVVEGKRLGRKLGFPTINQFFPPYHIVPAHGVYATKVKTASGVFPSVSNVGVRPTVDNTKVLNLETHIIGLDEELYNSEVQIEFYKFLRKEKRFESIEELRQVIKNDIRYVEKYFDYK